MTFTTNPTNCAYVAPLFASDYEGGWLNFIDYPVIGGVPDTVDSIVIEDCNGASVIGVVPTSHPNIYIHSERPYGGIYFNIYDLLPSAGITPASTACFRFVITLSNSVSGDIIELYSGCYKPHSDCDAPVLVITANLNALDCLNRYIGQSSTMTVPFSNETAIFGEVVEKTPKFDPVKHDDGSITSNTTTLVYAIEAYGLDSSKVDEVAAIFSIGTATVHDIKSGVVFTGGISTSEPFLGEDYCDTCCKYTLSAEFASKLCKTKACLSNECGFKVDVSCSQTSALTFANVTITTTAPTVLTRALQFNFTSTAARNAFVAAFNALGSVVLIQRYAPPPFLLDVAKIGGHTRTYLMTTFGATAAQVIYYTAPATFSNIVTGSENNHVPPCCAFASTTSLQQTGLGTFNTAILGTGRVVSIFKYSITHTVSVTPVVSSAPPFITFNTGGQLGATQIGNSIILPDGYLVGVNDGFVEIIASTPNCGLFSKKYNYY